LRGHGRQAAEGLEQWKTVVEERKPLDASPAAITLLLTGEELDSLEKGAGDGKTAGRGRSGGGDVASPQPAARHGEPAQVFPANGAAADGATADGWMGWSAGVGSIACAPTSIWSSTSGADMADLPGGASGLPVRDYKGKKADRLVTRIDPGVVSLVAETARPRARQTAEELGQGKTGVEEPKPLDASPAAIALTLLLTDEELEKGGGVGEIARGGRPGGPDVTSPQPAARHGEPAQGFRANAVPPTGDRGWMGVICGSRSLRDKRFGRRLTDRSRWWGFRTRNRPLVSIRGLRVIRPSGAMREKDSRPWGFSFLIASSVLNSRGQAPLYASVGNLEAFPLGIALGVAPSLGDHHG
jgi:hypothetical protein